ncbi:MAG TPA: hypothetical protein VGR28_12710 [Candidatus Thermoplasmatota archaeon]|nr:hypothetical protein [Candidatus Thermoplasmatota archaeon]
MQPATRILALALAALVLSLAGLALLALRGLASPPSPIDPAIVLSGAGVALGLAAMVRYNWLPPSARLRARPALVAAAVGFALPLGPLVGALVLEPPSGWVVTTSGSLVEVDPGTQVAASPTFELDALVPLGGAQSRLVAGYTGPLGPGTATVRMAMPADMNATFLLLANQRCDERGCDPGGPSFRAPCSPSRPGNFTQRNELGNFTLAADAAGCTLTASLPKEVRNVAGPTMRISAQIDAPPPMLGPSARIQAAEARAASPR